MRACIHCGDQALLTIAEPDPGKSARNPKIVASSRTGVQYSQLKLATPEQANLPLIMVRVT